MVTSRSASVHGLAGPGERIGASTGDLDGAEAGGRCWITPMKPAGRPRRGAGGRRPIGGVSSPSRSSVVEDAPKQTVAR